MMQLCILVFACKGVQTEIMCTFVYTYTCILVEFLKRCLNSPSAERNNHERPPEPDGGFETVFSPARRASVSQITSMTASLQGEIHGQN